MNKSITKRLSRFMAESCLNSNYLNKEDLSDELFFNIENSLLGIMREFSSKEDARYMKMLDIQSKKTLGSKEYIRYGYKLAAAKQRKISAHELTNKVNQECKYNKLKSFIYSNFGKQVLIDFFKTLQS